MAAGAAILAAPVLGPLAGASSAGAASSRAGVTTDEVAQRAAASARETQLLSYGDTGPAVAAVQHQLQIVEDGIFGPQTEGAVKSFQSWKGLATTGIVDAKTWAELFGSRVLFYDETAGDEDATAQAAAQSSGESVRVAFEEEPAPDAESAPNGGGDLDDRSELRDEIDDPQPEPDAESTPPEPATPPAEEPAPQPAPTGDGCTPDGQMVAPVNGTVTSPYGEDRGDHSHSGTDIAAPTGTTVAAAECGTVTVSGSQSGYGLMVCVRHAGDTTTCYAHLSEQSVAVNEYVKAGQKIGEVGCTGSCTGPHVHFEVRQRGSAIDPAPYLSGSSKVKATTAAGSDNTAIGGPTPADEARVFATTGGVTAPEAQATEQPAPATTAPAAAPVAGAPAPVAEAPAPVAGAPAPVAEAPAPAPVNEAPVEAPAPVTEEPAVEAPAPAPVNEAPVEAPAPAPVNETPVEAPAPVTEEPAVEAPAPAPVNETPVEAPAPVAEEPAVEAPAPAPVNETPVEAPAPVAEEPAVEAPAPAPVSETPVEAPAPVAEEPAPAPVAEAPAPAAEAPAADVAATAGTLAG